MLYSAANASWKKKKKNKATVCWMMHKPEQTRARRVIRRYVGAGAGCRGEQAGDECSLAGEHHRGTPLNT